MKHFDVMLPMEDGVKLYTLVILPDGEGPHSVVFFRTPYDPAPSEELIQSYAPMYAPYLENGFAIVWQHCRGRGGSEGDFVPFMGERADGLKTLSWIEQQDFCDGRVYLCGGSYLAYVHLSYLAVAPACVKGAALAVMCVDGSKAFFKDGAYKADLGPMWYMDMYHHSDLTHDSSRETYDREFRKYPLAEFPRRAYGYSVPSMDEILSLLENPLAVRGGYSEARYAMRGCRIPVLLKDGWSEMFLTGMLDMWHELPEEIRKQSAFLMGPWGHGCAVDPACPYPLSNGNIEGNPELDWLIHLRDGVEAKCVTPGMVKYYAVGEGEWKLAEDFPDNARTKHMYLTTERSMANAACEGEISWIHDPEDPPFFPGGPDSFNTPPYAMAAQPQPNFRPDVISFVSEPLTADMPLAGRIRIVLQAASDCDDTAFVARVCCVEQNGTATIMQEGVMHLDPYVPGEWKEISVELDNLCWTLHPGQRLRLDLSSADAANYFVHPNYAGDWRYIDKCRKANNRISLAGSKVELPIG